MKIKYAIVSSDSNPLYCDFWPLVKDLWYNHIGIKPILVYISDQDSVEEYDDCIVHKVKALDNVNTGFQSQIIRMFITKFYPNDVCLTSDIDMLPLGKGYFNRITKEFKDDDLVILSADAYPNKVRYPICYNASKGSTFSEILDLDCSFREYVDRLSKFKWGWDTDELYFGMMVDRFVEQSRVIKLKRGWSFGIADGRVDRVRWGYDKERLKNDQYIDSHSLRPYSEYKSIVDKLILDTYG